MESRNLTEDRPYPMDFSHDIDIENQWQIYFDEAHNLIEENQSTTINLILSSLMNHNLNEFWRYEGSLTTPPCTENVIWTVFKQPIFILNYEFETFRDDLFFESYRGPQPLSWRNVFRSFPEEIRSVIPEQSCCSNESASTFFLQSYVIVLFFFPIIHYYSRFD